MLMIEIKIWLWFLFGKSFLLLMSFLKKLRYNWHITLVIDFFSSVQLLSRVRLFVTPWVAARQASLSITNSQSSLKLTFIELVMPSSHLILCCPLFLLPPIPFSIRVFSNESTLRVRWPKSYKPPLGGLEQSLLFTHSQNVMTMF